MKLNKTAKLTFYQARTRKGDLDRLSEMTNYSKSHICNILSGRRNVNDPIASAMYRISRNRAKNTEIVKYYSA